MSFLDNVINRYVIVKAIASGNDLIPNWDERIIFEEADGEDKYTNCIKIKNSYNEHFSFVDCIWDLKEKKLLHGIEIDYYPSENNLKFKTGEEVYFEKEHRALELTKIKEIVFETYEIIVFKGDNVDSFWIKNLDIVFEKTNLYAVKIWKPCYVLENGMKTIYTNQLYQKFEPANEKNYIA